MDFTKEQYRELLASALNEQYVLTSFGNYCEKKGQLNKFIILKQDVDKKPLNSLKIAVLQAELGIKSSFYFRIVKQSYNEHIISEIVKLGHEIGYHYEDLTICKGNYKKAIERFKINLNMLRKLYPVKTICMHGSPLSSWDNRLLWARYNYREFGIIGEPFIDLDFRKVFYLTDTGRRWNGTKYSVRDKVDNSYNLQFKTTKEIIEAFNLRILPANMMINIHPQRWHDNLLLWLFELISQKLKNQIKRYFIIKTNTNVD